MKIDPDLIRKILFAYEALPLNTIGCRIVIEGCPEDKLIFHQLYLGDAGYIEFGQQSADNKTEIFPYRLTPAGNEFLNLCRKDTTWNRAKKTLKPATGFTLELMKAALLAYLTSKIPRP